MLPAPQPVRNPLADLVAAALSTFSIPVPPLRQSDFVLWPLVTYDADPDLDSRLHEIRDWQREWTKARRKAEAQRRTKRLAYRAARVVRWHG